MFILCWGGGGGEGDLSNFNKKKWKEFQKGESFESFGKLKRKKGFTHLINKKMMSFIKREEL